MTTRRVFIGKLAGLISAIGLVSLPACSRDEEGSSSAADRKLLNAFVDTIVPKDQDAGAVEAGVPEKLLVRFSKKPEAEKKVQMMLKVIDELARARFQAAFAQSTLKQREMLVDTISKSRDKNHKVARTTILRMRGWIIKAYYSSTTAWEMLAFSAPYPGGYPDFNKAPPL
jgi:hypothetical protein